MTDPITTPAEMREAAARECDRLGAEFAAEGAPTAKRMMDLASDRIRAMPVAEAAPVAVKVKPLEFEGRNGFWRAADGLGGFYEICEVNGGFHMTQITLGVGSAFVTYPTIDAAQAAANADHAARVLSQIDAVPASQVRAEALREAARECDKLAGDPQAVRVKPLVAGRHPRGFIATDHGGGGAYIFALNGGRYECIKGLAHSPRFDTSKEAQAAANADHAARVLSQIDAVPVAQVRAEALREAVKLADEKHRAYFTAKGRNPDDYVSEYSQLAASIRALMEKEQT